jgi:hypothetical protein
VPQCERDRDCREGRRCLDTRWHGKKCLDVSAACKKDSDCDACEECIRNVNHDLSTCVRKGERCKTDKDCKEEQVVMCSITKTQLIYISNGYHKLTFVLVLIPSLNALFHSWHLNSTKEDVKDVCKRLFGVTGKKSIKKVPNITILPKQKFHYSQIG